MPAAPYTPPLIPDGPPPPRRPVGAWLLLLCVWAVGLAIWGVYLAFIVMVMVRVLG